MGKIFKKSLIIILALVLVYVTLDLKEKKSSYEFSIKTQTVPYLESHPHGEADSVEMPNSASLTFSTAGQYGLDTTSNNFMISTSTDTESFVGASATSTLYSFSVASTSPSVLDEGYEELAPYHLPQVATAISCKVDGGTSQVVTLSDDGTNDTNSVTCTTSWTRYALTTNQEFNADEDIRIEYGTRTGATNKVIISVLGYTKTN